MSFAKTRTTDTPLMRRPEEARSRSATAASLAVALLLLAPHAHATIVWEGREVPAWPDLESGPSIASAPRDAARALALIKPGLFPRPSGVVQGLTILVDFSDQAAAYSKAEIDAWLNQPGYQKFGLKGSVRDYYFQQSNGNVDYQNEVHGFYRAQKPKSYYQGGTGYERASELWSEVTAALDGEIDFSRFDNDRDGKTEAISLLYAGNEGSFGKGLWPHASSSNDQRDGVRLNRYMMAALNTQPTNYTVAHESGHMLFGWPDLYGVGDYCIMANRDSDLNPVGINDAFRADQGWIDVQEIERAGSARFSAAPKATAYRYLNPARPTEYFLWSNVQNREEWVSLRAGGLLVWHFDKSIGANNPPAKLELAVVQAAPGSRQLGSTTWPSPGSAASDFFAAGRNAEFSANTSPNSAWNDGSASGLRIYDISTSNLEMQFSVGTGAPVSSGGTSASAGAPGNTGGAGNVAASGASGSAGSKAGNSFGGAIEAAGGAAANAAGGMGSSTNPPGVGGVNSTPGAHTAGADSLGSGAMASNAPVDSRAESGCSCRAAGNTGERSPHFRFGLLLASLLLLLRRRWPRLVESGRGS